MNHKYTQLFILVIFISTSIFAQTRIDNQIPFQSDPAKQYSVFVPSSYDANVPNKLMLGMHPFNTNRWNSVSWCDTLIAFAEANDLILICPDGGADGKVDDPIDTAFTTFIMDSTLIWYNIDESKIFAMGFSWGGRTTYTYGLNNVEKFAGFMPIGAAINGTNEVNAVIQNAENKPFYLVHGNNDAPATRYFPALNALNANNACTETNLMSGVGHTIDFPNRNQILTDAFVWLDSVSCGVVNGVFEKDISNRIELFPNPISEGDFLNLRMIGGVPDFEKTEILDLNGKVVLSRDFSEKIDLKGLNSGMYFLRLNADNQLVVKKFILE